jgi:chemotaxis protein MotA
LGKKGLDTASVIGLALGLGSLAGAMTLEFQELNPDFGSAFLKLSALLIIFGGTFGCTMLSFRIEEVMKIPTYLKIAMFSDHYDEDKLIDQVRTLAEIARRDGILAIESKRDELSQSYPFLADGFQFVIDGTPPDKVKELLANEIVSM